MNAREQKCSEKGFTIIEMIGVLGVIAVLGALILPKVFDVVAQAKIEALLTACKTLEGSIAKYYTDVGTLLPLNTAGSPQTENSGDSSVDSSLGARLVLSSYDPLVLTTNLWPKFSGPYLEKFDTNKPPAMGMQMFLPARKAVVYGTGVTAQNLGWDIKGDDGNSDLPTNVDVVYLQLTGIGETDFMAMDKGFDPDIGNDAAEKKLRGRAKWSSASNGTLYLYLAHH
ncbi:MAG: hypothetical protein IH977_08620 [Nitrospinae bacterium]|nr:hypothetical protein [Nitrospinota bacterium]